MALFFTYLLPIVLPTVIYLLWRMITPRRASPASGGAETSAAEGTGADTDTDSGADSVAARDDDLWRDAPWLWLSIAGMALLVVVLLFGAFVHGSPQRGQYLPPRMENGQIVPGELRPADRDADRPGGSLGGPR